MTKYETFTKGKLKTESHGEISCSLVFAFKVNSMYYYKTYSQGSVKSQLLGVFPHSQFANLE